MINCKQAGIFSYTLILKFFLKFFSQLIATMETNPNPLLSLEYEPVMENLGDDYYDVVAAADFPEHHLRFRNDLLLPLLGLNPQKVDDEDFIEAFGMFEGVRPFLALRYHGYQFGEYNPFLGDGRGFLYGQVRGMDGNFYDLGRFVTTPQRFPCFN